MVLIPLAINHVDPMIKETWKQEGNNGSINTQQYSVALGQHRTRTDARRSRAISSHIEGRQELKPRWIIVHQQSSRCCCEKVQIVLLLLCFISLGTALVLTGIALIFS